MKKHSKHILLMLACIVLLTAVLSACSSNSGSNSAAYAKENSVQASNASEQVKADNVLEENRSSSAITTKSDSTSSYEESSIKVYVDGKELALESAPIDRRGEEYFPIDEVAQAIGAKVTVDSKRSTITISKGKRKHVLHDKGNKFPVIDGVKYAPIGAIAGGLYTQIRFNHEDGAVYLTTM